LGLQLLFYSLLYAYAAGGDFPVDESHQNRFLVSRGLLCRSYYPVAMVGQVPPKHTASGKCRRASRPDGQGVSHAPLRAVVCRMKITAWHVRRKGGAPQFAKNTPRTHSRPRNSRRWRCESSPRPSVWAINRNCGAIIAHGAAVTNTRRHETPAVTIRRIRTCP
jgi:hypothetical protein